MHILEIPSFFPPYGGEFCLDQAKALKALGHEVRILSHVQLGATIGLKDYLLLPYRRYEYQRDGITVYQSYQRGLPKMVHHNVKHWISIVESMFSDYVAKYGRPDILHAHCAKWAGYASMKIAKQYGVPYVITEHLPLMLLREEFGDDLSKAWQIPLLRKAYEEANMVVPVSEELVEDTSYYYGADYRWQFISNTIDTDFFHYESRQPRRGRSFRFCCVADYHYRKGYDVLFEAFRLLQARGFDVELVVAGLHTDGYACKTAIGNRLLNGVKTYGRIDREGIRKLLYDSDAFVLASRSEVQPLVLLEAMSTGIPVVSTECTPKSLRIRECCIIVPVNDIVSLADAMEKIMEAPVIDGQALSNQIRALASPAVVGKKLSKLFSSVIASV